MFCEDWCVMVDLDLSDCIGEYFFLSFIVFLSLHIENNVYFKRGEEKLVLYMVLVLLLLEFEIWNVNCT